MQHLHEHLAIHVEGLKQPQNIVIESILLIVLVKHKTYLQPKSNLNAKHKSVVT